jgi:hypothetical protein
MIVSPSITRTITERIVCARFGFGCEVGHLRHLRLRCRSPEATGSATSLSSRITSATGAGEEYSRRCDETASLDLTYVGAGAGVTRC